MTLSIFSLILFPNKKLMDFKTGWCIFMIFTNSIFEFSYVKSGFLSKLKLKPFPLLSVLESPIACLTKYYHVSFVSNDRAWSSRSNFPPLCVSLSQSLQSNTYCPPSSSFTSIYMKRKFKWITSNKYRKNNIFISLALLLHCMKYQSVT